MLPQKIEAQVEFLRKHPGVSVVITDYINFTKDSDYNESHFMTCPNVRQLIIDNQVSKGGSFVLGSEKARMFLSEENFSIANSPLLRREIINDVGAFDESLNAGEDFEFTYRTAFKYDIGVVNIIGFKRRIHESNLSHDHIKVLEGKISGRKKVLMMERNKRIRRKLKYYISLCELSLCEIYIGIDNRAALKECARSYCLTPFKLLQAKAKIMAKIGLSLLGISTQSITRIKRKFEYLPENEDMKTRRFCVRQENWR